MGDVATERMSTMNPMATSARTTDTSLIVQLRVISDLLCGVGA
jgi:hypothetical protein